MPTKRNKAGYQQHYVEKGHGDESGEYRDNGYGGSATNINHGRQNAQVTNNYLGYQTKAIEKSTNKNYNNNDDTSDKKPQKEDTTDESRTDEFRRIQEKSLGMSNQEISEYHAGKRTIDEALRELLSRTFKLELQSSRSSRNYIQWSLLNPITNSTVKVYGNVNGGLFHDIFQINRNYLKYGELVDLHDNYDDATCYLSDDGLSGFAITKSGDLVSVFNLNNTGGFLKTVAPIIKKKVKTLDCYVSQEQNLQKMYSKIFGFKTASIMDYNMEYDHDDIAKNHNMPQVAFMVNTNKPVETKHFTKDQYNEAKEYQMKHIKK